MEKIYFTFGKDSNFPYPNSYLVVIASDVNDAVHEFREKYPDISRGHPRFSSYCDENQWQHIGEHYAGSGPAEIIWTETCFGKKPEGYEDLFVFVPEIRHIIRIAEGDGSNLHQVDLDNGYTDYVYYEQYLLGHNMPEIDGGQVMLQEPLRQRYHCLADSIPDVLGLAYDNSIVDCMILA